MTDIYTRWRELMDAKWLRGLTEEEEEEVERIKAALEECESVFYAGYVRRLKALAGGAE